MNYQDCLACQILRGVVSPPGGVIYENDFWLIDHSLPPVFILGNLTLKPKRHCEHLSELRNEEAATLGPLILRICWALQEVTGSEKIHVASYGEGVKHIHFLITPRTTKMPASNIQLTIWVLWRRFLFQSGYKGGVYREVEIMKLSNKVRKLMILEKNN
jgi:diadenosine tetraphosphate (Ap4A) HIT family hydrolase